MTIETKFEHIKKSPKTLYTFLKQMPKGGNLHVHFDGSADLDKLISLAKKRNYCVDPKTATLHQMSATCQVPLRTFMRNANHRQQIRTAWSMEKLAPNDPQRYEHFFNIFQKVALIYQDFTIPLLADMIRHAAQQHVLYLEIIMLNPRQHNESIPTVSSASTFAEKRKILLSNPKIQHLIHQQITAADTYLKQARASLGCKTNPKLPACAVTVKFQYFALRENPIDEVFSDALVGFAAAAKSTSIVGINMVQPENGGRAAKDFRQQMQILAFLHQVYPTVPVSLHAGELTLDMARHPSQQNHIQDAIHRGHAQRIGHGAALFAETQYQSLVKTMVKQGIAVEINLTSNQDILALSGQNHPFPFYLHHHVPVILSTDDEGISETNLSQEFFKATQQYDLDYATIKRINRNALTYSFLPGQSLWLNAYQQIPLPICHNLMSIGCQKLIEKSPKAQLQWNLEKDLADFEAQWTN